MWECCQTPNWDGNDLDRTIVALRDQGQIISDDLLAHLSPLGWEHINLTGDYIWNSDVTEDLPPSRQLTLQFLDYPEASSA